MFEGLEKQFYQSFVEGDRWMGFLKGLGISFEVTLGALLLGTALGILVAVIRTSHDQQAPGKNNFFLAVLNGICKVYSTVIPRNVRLAEAPSFGMPITEYDPKSKGAEAYMDFAEEFLDLEEN